MHRIAGAGMSRTRLVGLATVIRTADAFDFFAVLGLINVSILAAVRGGI